MAHHERSFVRTARTLAIRMHSTQPSYEWIALLLARLSVGLLFLSTGWGKVQHISNVTGFFESLGIPAPGFNAVLVGYSELLCGGALVIGFLSRLATVPLIVTMVVAMLTAQRGEIHGLFDLVGLSEFTYLVVLVMIVLLGSGAASVDHFMASKLAPSTGPKGGLDSRQEGALRAGAARSVQRMG